MLLFKPINYIELPAIPVIEVNPKFTSKFFHIPKRLRFINANDFNVTMRFGSSCTLVCLQAECYFVYSFYMLSLIATFYFITVF